MPPEPATPSALLIIPLVTAIVMASAGLWVGLIAGWRHGRRVLPIEPREPIRWRPAVLAVSLGWVVLQAVGHLFVFLRELTGTPHPTAEPLRAVDVLVNALISLMIWAGVLAALWWQSPRRALSDYGLTFRGVGRQTKIGALGVLAAALPVLAASILLLPFRTRETQHTLLQLLRDHPTTGVVTAVAFAAVVAAPLMEELLFRVVLQGWLTTVLPERAALVIAAAVFAAVHGLPDALPLFPLALILGVVYHRTHRYFAVVLLHALFNAANLAFALLSLWGSSE